MPEKVQISCITKVDRYDPYTRIQYVGGTHNGKRFYISLDRAIEHIENNKFTFFTDVNGHKRDVIIAVSSAKNKYLKTTADYDTPDNLLSLNSCSVN